MTTSTGTTFVSGTMILAGVQLLVLSVFHTWLIWPAGAALALGLMLMLASCYETRLPGGMNVNLSPRRGEPPEGGDERCR